MSDDLTFQQNILLGYISQSKFVGRTTFKKKLASSSFFFNYIDQPDKKK